MTREDKKKWNARYAADIGRFAPSDIVRKYVSLAPKGQALDIACGNGRNSEFLAREGFTVDAVDISDIGLGRLPDNDGRINKRVRDMDVWPIPRDRYQLIINIRFLDRRLFPMIENALKPGGLLIFESFIDDKKDYCLRPNELLHAFGALRILYYEEKKNAPSDKFEQSVYMAAQKQGTPCILS